MSLIDPQRPRAVAGQAGYEYQKVASADFDGDGVEEKVFLIANAAVVNGEPQWDDGQTWQVYVEEPTGERTYLFVRFEQLGMVEAVTARAEANQAPKIVLIERTPWLVGAYEIQYRKPTDVQVRVLVQQTLDPRVGFGTPTNP